ncbi:MAG: hypothetical protein IJX94_04880 [Clostridia bacterium]|nr:hypothetical protein [Clostridia bacterium]
MKKRTITSKASISKPSRICLIYGLYAILFQLSILFLFMLTEQSTVSADVLLHIYLPLLEYPLMSLTLLLGGCLLIDYILKKG